MAPVIPNTIVSRAEGFSSSSPGFENICLDFSRLLDIPHQADDASVLSYVMTQAKYMACKPLTWHVAKTLEDDGYWTCRIRSKNDGETLMGFSSLRGKRAICYNDKDGTLTIWDHPTYGPLTLYSACTNTKHTELKIGYKGKGDILKKQRYYDTPGFTLSAHDTTGGFILLDDAFGTSEKSNMKKALKSHNKDIGLGDVSGGEGIYKLERWLTTERWMPASYAPNSVGSLH